ncbi:MAG: Arc family DNA-binding protein [Candidatus Omnitrophica bacterium]|nr:Arc family DNA-binding protein [Candidatus Omnitrophota bacterium]
MSEKKKFLLRVDKPVFEVLEKWAADNFRSVNAQIEYILAEALKKDGRASKDNKEQEG